MNTLVRCCSELTEIPRHYPTFHSWYYCCSISILSSHTHKQKKSLGSNIWNYTLVVLSRHKLEDITKHFINISFALLSVVVSVFVHILPSYELMESVGCNIYIQTHSLLLLWADRNPRNITKHVIRVISVIILFFRILSSNKSVKSVGCNIWTLSLWFWAYINPNILPKISFVLSVLFC